MTNLSGANLNNGAAVGPQGEGRDSPSRFPKYPEYKNSGHEWVGEIPSHWYVYRSKNIFSERNVKALESDEQLTASQKYGVIPQRLFSELEGQKVMQVILGRDILKKAEVNDFVISMRSFQGGLEFCSYSGAVSSAYVPLYANREIDNRFFKHLFKSVSFISALQNTSNLVRDGQALRYNNFVQLSLPFPSLNEQRTIGAFLDHETARIDALIEDQQRLIELLKEKRQAVISHAVTKGLDPTVPMKDSGVEWLGEVPAHWDVLPVWMLFQMGRGRVISHDEIAENSGDYPVYSSQTERDGVMGSIDTYDFEGDYLTWTTDGANAGTVFRRSGKFNCTNVCGTLLPKRKDDDLRYFVDAVGICTAAFIRHDINPKLMNNVMASIKVPVPPLMEQIAIAAYVSGFKDKETVLIQEAFTGISLLQERRSALISAAVTGKIDVRGWQPPASAQAPESAVAEAN
ncbi:hypothetical protein B2J73_16200 [Stutzerimonas stutzeri]|uniref:restriction endonuclease subunit S n=2 Tax=Stutzerimonas stutzeri TaxID=316 RepID=UPI0009A447D2|nr:restriction endonuclease subunit S [Stutzerimonas stutzeri]MBH3353829.1 restriction endonuclease subunit S [Stutzerimonas stutzeri]OPG82409.1 hypothetical protein B2J73_16200 [Stutzerimonas stutzeri]TFZ24179.1 restriction endonuclease subunit S [Stutzerimonas stutzeri]CAB5521592.1 Type I restriction enzyme specificity protein MPN_089 [Stutzerimonas stutzeri]CAB5544679.1 Type I restriction enzyme specificity protein MPN_089 [Stutzerimonas stutzeri]